MNGFDINVVSEVPATPDPRLVYLHLVSLADELGKYPSAIIPQENEPVIDRYYKSDRRKALTAIVLLQILSKYLHTTERDLKISHTAEGKPYLNNAPGPLKFNLSHAGEWIALVVCPDFFVGVDIEPVTCNEDLMALASTLSPEVYNWLDKISIYDRRRAFFDYWTTNEAIMKCIGLGFLHPAIDPEKVVHSHGQVLVEGIRVSYQRINILADYSISVAVCFTGSSPSLRLV